LGVKNPYVTWSAIKGKLKINNDGTFEIPLKTVLRELLEELSLQFKGNRRKLSINEKNIDHFLALNKNKFLQCQVDTRRNSNDRLRLIGLFIIPVDENKWIFTLKDKKENKVFMNPFLNLKKRTKILKCLFSFCFRHVNG